MHNTALELYNDLLQIHFDEYYSLLGVKRSKTDSKYDPANLTLDEYDYSEWHKELDDLPPVEVDEEKYILHDLRNYQKVLKKEND